ncbi:anhydro-N-acetylmuramic acid kinase [Flavobacterium sediminilitoris]|uniref:Anhydro-N-acetylmuramic acid kinase n=1 Tax=Flavobacterium sediminilitoris TaxID=2024526 RepID=A0ABY4HNV1_9FLAO|nr:MULTISPECIES: anhydro-N-acetylmuramic acid kinase [Flavobacterium]UOX34545.1 anhydro-N-acetylmuramic acid kinase [Flavobacterium sediminilitoris]
MQKDSYSVIGVMSGTSLDGVDLVYVTLSFSSKWNFKIHIFETVPYTEYWISMLSNSIHLSNNELLDLNQKYTEELAKIISEFITKNEIQNIDIVCSHGHTVLHQPENGFTLQIGNLSKIAELIKQNVVCDFRVQDVQLGGQGAPLVPIGDRLLFSEYDYCLNLGGFSNISFEEDGERIAFDISPVNTVLNFYANQLGLNYDDKGNLAKKGLLNNELLIELNSLIFYEQSYPKSLGMEFVNSKIFPVLNKYSIPVNDILRTFVEHIAFQISKVIVKKNTSVLITGGGAYNDFLIERIKSYLPNINLVIPNNIIVESKEALVFALLGVLKLRNENNTLASVTGARQNHSAGNVFTWK